MLFGAGNHRGIALHDVEWCAAWYIAYGNLPTSNDALHGVSTPNDALHAAGMNRRRWLLLFVRPESTWFFALYLRLIPSVSQDST
jgi:hypothetical protein